MALEGNYRDIYYDFIDNNVVSDKEFEIKIEQKDRLQII